MLLMKLAKSDANDLKLLSNKTGQNYQQADPHFMFLNSRL